jgi:hypothetical protein
VYWPVQGWYCRYCALIRLALIRLTRKQLRAAAHLVWRCSVPFPSACQVLTLPIPVLTASVVRLETGHLAED